jgi:ABC-type multidrug transport system ATPase subunit
VIERVGIITRGRLIALGTPGELKRRVDQQVRLELVFRNGGGEEFLLPLPTARKVGRLHWVVYVSPAEVEHMVSRIVREVGLETLEDFRILTPTLEDVYLHLGGDGLLG